MTRFVTCVWRAAGAVINAGSRRMDDVLESIVPAEYNSASKLVQEVKLDTKTVDFKLVTPAGK